MNPTTMFVLAALMTAQPAEGGERVPVDRAGVAPGGLHITLETASQEVEAGMLVDVRVSIVNMTDGDLVWEESRPEQDFLFSVSDEHGKPVPLTRYGKRVEAARGVGRVGHGFKPVRLAPGEKRTYTVRINRLFDMTLIGKYEVSAKYVSPLPRPQGFELVSEKATIAIISPRAGEAEKKQGPDR